MKWIKIIGAQIIKSKLTRRNHPIERILRFVKKWNLRIKSKSKTVIKLIIRNYFWTWLKKWKNLIIKWINKWDIEWKQIT